MISDFDELDKLLGLKETNKSRTSFFTDKSKDKDSVDIINNNTTDKDNAVDENLKDRASDIRENRSLNNSTNTTGKDKLKYLQYGHKENLMTFTEFILDNDDDSDNSE